VLIIFLRLILVFLWAPLITTKWFSGGEVSQEIGGVEI